MPRSIFNATITFGLVNVPIKLYSATESKTVHFTEVHESDGAKIEHRRLDPESGEEVPYDEIVKGYEIAPDRYVTISDSELQSVAPKASRLIEIEEFVDLAEIDPLFYESSYYLVPDKGAAKAYSLLVQAMREAGKVAIARVVLRNKEHLVALRPAEGALMMETMNFHDEVVPAEDLDELLAAQEATASDREVAMAKQLIGSLTTDFEPTRYADTYREKVLELIERKAAGEEVAVQPEAPAPAAVPDLMAALEASLAAVKKDEPSKPAPAKRRPPAKRKTAA